jgi:hypothetical protein
LLWRIVMKLDPDERGNGEESPTIPAPQGEDEDE